MQTQLHQNLAEIGKLLGMQKDSALTEHWTEYSDYMYGMYNGLALAHSALSKTAPSYANPPHKPKSKIRHKSRK